MTPRTGLGPVELALLDAFDLLGADSDGRRVRCSDVLTAVDQRHGIGPRYAWPVTVDLGVTWRVHLPLLDLYGNLGTQGGDPPADARYVEGRLSPVGALALAAERGEIGPVPLGLIEGSLYREGSVPPFAPHAVVGALLAGRDDCGSPVLPTGGTVEGDLQGLLAGRPVRLRLGCTIRDEIERLVITEVPLGVDADRVIESITNRLHRYERGEGRALAHVRRTDAGSAVLDVRDDTSARDGLRIVLQIERSTNVARVLEWLRSVWPVTIEVDARLPLPQPERLAGWDRGDGSGLRALADLLREPTI
jgi:hypothetical protein